MVQSLAPYAVRVEQSRGRRHPEPRHSYRNDFQRDRDRVIHSRAFRRLEAKTQVFTRRYSDHFRNRLTHTIEVAQISRTIAAQLGLNVDLVEALALVHDIGHPPFGHAGEKALDTAMRQHGLLFDHNLHALRIVEDFELRYAAFRGLNLTFEVREGIIKHSRDYDDDGYEARLLTLDQIRDGVPVFAHFFREVEQLYPDAPKKLQFNEVLRRMLDRWVGDLILNTRVQINAITLDDVRACPNRLVNLSSEKETERRQTKEFLYHNLYFSPTLEPEKDDAERVITELFDLWMKHPEKLPASYQEKAEAEPLARIVCDYIAGMTDTYILEQYEKHCGHGKASAG